MMRNGTAVCLIPQSGQLLMMVGILLASYCSCALAGSITVHIEARLGGGGQSIDLHCLSGDTDLGDHQLADGQEFDWNFSPSILGNTLFYCNVNWNGTATTFNAYDFHRDFNRCSSNCLWLVAREGFYWFDGAAQFWQYQFPWP